MDNQNDIVSESVPQYKYDTSHPLFEDGKYYTYSEYRRIIDNDGSEPPIRYELINGTPVVMDAPSWMHQNISIALVLQLGNFLKGKQCKVFSAPFDVRLNASDADDTVVQPDILVICDHSKLSGTGCIGAPDMVIEILSPSTARHDRIVKLQLYEKFGVREYWLIDPEINAVTVYVLENGRYYVKPYRDTDVVPVHVLEGCTVELSEIFE